MNTKRNLAMAVLVALLAVPAFSANTTKASANMKASSPGYAEGISNLGGETKIPPTHVGNIWSRNFHGNHYALNSKTGQAIINGVPVSGRQALYDINEGTGPTAKSNTTHSTTTNSSTKGSNITNSSLNEPSNNPEYQNSNTNNGKLVQTGENDGASKAIFAGDISLMAGASLVALSVAEKHRKLAKEDITTNTAYTNDKKVNGHNYSTKSNYDMIMNNTFTKLSNNLKNL